jgi:hypothetical protein
MAPSWTQTNAALLLPLKAKKKTAGKNSQPFQEEVLQQPLSSNKAISAVPLQPFKPED